MLKVPSRHSPDVTGKTLEKPRSGWSAAGIEPTSSRMPTPSSNLSSLNKLTACWLPLLNNSRIQYRALIFPVRLGYQIASTNTRERHCLRHDLSPKPDSEAIYSIFDDLALMNERGRELCSILECLPTTL